MRVGTLTAQDWPLAAATGLMAAVVAALAAGGGATPTDLGLAAYPGATPVGGTFSRVRTADATTLSAAYETTDPIDRVAAYYRAALRTSSASQQLFDDPSREGVSLMLSHGPHRRSVIVDIDRTASGTSIQIKANQPVPRAVPRCVARSSVCARPSSPGEPVFQRMSSSSG